MNYEHERRLIFSNDPVHISGEAVNLSARSLTYDLNLNKIIFAGNVEALITEGFAVFPSSAGRGQ
jgi:hypothetical protein